MKKSDIATSVAITIVHGIITNYNVKPNELFEFMKNDPRYNGMLNDDDLLILMSHDNSHLELIDFIGEQINEKNGLSRNNI